MKIEKETGSINIYVKMEINKYQKWYFQLIEKARVRELHGYAERHHIVPRCLGGTDDQNNLVRLTAREHLIAHMLLPRFVEDSGPAWRALWCMATMGEQKVTGKTYEIIRTRYSAIHSQTPSPMKGVPRTSQTRQKISEANKNKTPWNKGKQLTDSDKAKKSLAAKGRRLSKECIEKMKRTKIEKSHILPFYLKKAEKTYGPYFTFVQVKQAGLMNKNSAHELYHGVRKLVKGYSLQFMQEKSRLFLDGLAYGIDFIR